MKRQIVIITLIGIAIISTFLVLRDKSNDTIFLGATAGIPISVPSATGLGYMLTSDTNGRYVASSTEGITLGRINATSTTASFIRYASSTALTVSGAFYNSSLSDGCANITSGLLGSTGSACGAGGGGLGWASTTVPDSNSIFSTAIGNVGIGTTSPYEKLSVVGDVVAAMFHATSSNNGSTNLFVAQNVSAGTSATAGFAFQNNNGGTGAFGSFGSNYNVIPAFAGRLALIGDLTSSTATGLDFVAPKANDFITFYAGGLTSTAFEKMRISNVGVLLGTTTNPGDMASMVIATSTGQQLELTDGGSLPYSIRSVGGSLYFATSSPTTGATSTPILELRSLGTVSLQVATTSPMTQGNAVASIGGSINVGLKSGATVITSTSTFVGNVRVTNVMQAGDLCFSNGFCFTEKLPMNDGSLQALILKNHKGEEIWRIDDEGKIDDITTPKDSNWSWLGLLGLLGFIPLIKRR